MNSKKSEQGFSLIEILVVIAIVGILAAISYPSYTTYVNKSRRAEARSELLELASAFERYFSDQSTYVGATARLNPGSSEHDHYTITAAETEFTYALSAAPAGAQTSDDCGTYTLNSIGTKGSALSIGECW